MSEFQTKLAGRCELARLQLAAPEAAQLEAYFDLLVRWNARINLTALPLGGAPDATIDRLFIEPLVAARSFPDSPLGWFDIGSGGGSPAIPLKVLRPAAQLTMVESRGRKAAFLRQAVRELELIQTTVAEARFDAIAPTNQVDIVTIRAVRVDQPLADLCRRALRLGGKMLLFQSSPVGSVQFGAGFGPAQQVQLTNTPAFLGISEAI